MPDTAAGPASAVWAITAYFNPFHAPRRLANYRLFRERLALPLLAVELAHGSEFGLTDVDADRLVQVRDGDVMWQKERLLNVALQALPPSCGTVVWLDADVVLARIDWIAGLLDAVNSHRLVQPFSRALLLPEAATPGGPTSGALTRESVIAAFSEGLPLAEWMGRFGQTHGKKFSLGYAWAARRELLDRHGFFDASIIGGGDRALLCAAYGAFDLLIEKHHLNRHQARHFLEWAEPFHDDVRGSVGFVHGDLHHLWHGELETRRYAERHADLAALDFNPCADIAVGSDGAWRWNSDKPELRRLLSRYLSSRSVAEGTRAA